MFDDNSILNYDMDGDGANDSYAEQADMDGDGINETEMLFMDSNGDGIFDTEIVTSDIDHDGNVETVYSQDTNGDGELDSEIVYSDSNGDGLYDVAAYTIVDGTQTALVNEIDINQDGIPEIVTTDVDLDGDGVFETHYETQNIDIDGNGVIDTVVFGVDGDQDGVFDSVKIYQDINLDGQLELAYIDYTPMQDGSVALLPEDDIMQNFDPNDPANDPSQIVGDPGADMEHWEFQGDTNRCALFSQKSVIEELTGQEIDIEDFCDIAVENGWFTEDGGTYPCDMNKMLDYYGVNNEMSTNANIEDISECLNNGGKVIVAVDGDEIWDPNHDSIFFAPNDPNHAIEIIGIDNSDPENPMVIINDSGTVDGRGEMVPLDQFVDAWEDSGCQMIAAY